MEERCFNNFGNFEMKPQAFYYLNYQELTNLPGIYFQNNQSNYSKNLVTYQQTIFPIRSSHLSYEYGREGSFLPQQKHLFDPQTTKSFINEQFLEHQKMIKVQDNECKVEELKIQYTIEMIKKQFDSDSSPKQIELKNSKKQSKDLKKNTDSNLSHQTFTYLYTRRKSIKFLQKYLQYKNSYNHSKALIFYVYMKIIKKFTKKYFNKKQLLKIFLLDEKHPAYNNIIAHYKNTQVLDFDEFKKMIQVLILKFLNDQSPASILHSKKIQKQSLLEHFQRRRSIKLFLKSHIRKL